MNKKAMRAIQLVSAIIEIYKLLCRSGLTIKQLACQLTRMKKEHKKTPDDFGKLNLTELTLKTLDKDTKKTIDEHYSEVMTKINKGK